MKSIQSKICLLGVIAAFTAITSSANEPWIPQDYRLMEPSESIPPTNTVVSGIYLYNIGLCIDRPSHVLGSVKILPQQARNQKSATVTLSFFTWEEEKEKIQKYSESYKEEPYATGTADQGYFPFPKKNVKIVIPENATDIRIETLYAAPDEEEKTSFPTQNAKPSFKLYAPERCG